MSVFIKYALYLNNKLFILNLIIFLNHSDLNLSMAKKMIIWNIFFYGDRKPN